MPSLVWLKSTKSVIFMKVPFVTFNVTYTETWRITGQQILGTSYNHAFVSFICITLRPQSTCMYSFRFPEEHEAGFTRLLDFHKFLCFVLMWKCLQILHLFCVKLQFGYWSLYGQVSGIGRLLLFFNSDYSFMFLMFTTALFSLSLGYHFGVKIWIKPLA